VLTAALDVARTAILDGGVRQEQVGAHLGVFSEGERTASHVFEASVPGYVGWQWVVTLSRVSRAKTATVCEVVLLPSESAIVPPAWVPYA
jgi:hypothetical protein